MPIINPSFETGDFTGWNVNVPTGGSATVVTSFTTPFAPVVTFSPVQGNFFAVLKTDGSGNFTSVSQTFFACAGDQISGWAFFQSPEVPPTQFNDFAEVRILSGATLVATPYFASVNSTGDTGWSNWTYTFLTSGTYTLEARITNVGRAAVDSFMGLDAINLETAEQPITCPPDITVSNDPGQCGAVVEYPDPTVGCPDLTVTCSPPSGTFFSVGTTTVTCTATAATGNLVAECTFTVTVNDTEPPTITCPDDITVTNDPGECGAVVNYGNPNVIDNCPGYTISCTTPSGSFFPVGTTPVTCTATDASGNLSTCSFTITVNDEEPPTITCSDNIVVSNDPGQCGAFVNYPDPTVSDNCPDPTFFCTPGPGFFPVGTTTVNCTAIDTSGNSASCSFTITVNDDEPPTIICSPNITVPNTPGECGAVVNYGDPTVFDNCPDYTISCTPPSGSFFPVGTTTVTCTATDASGNTAVCTFNVTVIDLEPPTIICPTNIIQDNDPGQCGAVVNYSEPNVSDNCAVTTSCSPLSGSFFPVGTTPVTCTATDTSGNIASCTFNVTVNDTEPPIIVCSPDITVIGDPDLGGAIVNYPNALVSDNCPGAGAVCSPPPGSLFPFGTTTVTCTATDAAGNIATCSFTVTVVEQRFILSSKMVLDLRLKLLQNQQIRIKTDEND
ncbi:HYR domain-containing protein [Fictibacillus sp. UD]|uniref:HYR domain-containing protein n=1 Tax=Fictibacillus sp. UD TaxID=3038777 RepID=UPI003744DF69